MNRIPHVPARRLATAVLLAASLLAAAACGSDDDDSSADTPTTAAATTTVASAATTEAVTTAATVAPTEAGDPVETSAPPSTAPDIDLSGVKLVVAGLGTSLEGQLAAAGLLDDIPYDIEFAVFPGPAQVIEALNARAVDVGYGVGDVTLTLAQGNAVQPWDESNIPFKTVATFGWRDPVAYPPYVALVHSDSGIDTVEDLRGKKWAYNPGGNNQVNYLLSLKYAGLTPDDIEPVILDGFQAALAAFQQGDVDVWSGAYTSSASLIADGSAKILIDSQDVGQPGYSSIVARTDVLADPAKAAAIADLVKRLDAVEAFFEKNPQAQIDLAVANGQTPEQAEQSTKSGPGRFIPITPEVIAQEQVVADALQGAGVFPNPIDVSIAYTDEFNSSLVAHAGQG